MSQQDYNIISLFETPLQKARKGEWNYYIKEETQSFASYQTLIPNHKTDVIIRTDDVIDLDNVIDWLNRIFNIIIRRGSAYNVNKLQSSICTLLYQSSWKAILFIPIAYLGFSYMKTRKSPISGQKQYNGSLMLSQISIETTFDHIEEEQIPETKWKTTKYPKTIVITNKDIYDSGTAFVFGLTEMNGDRCIISTYNLEKSFPRLLKILTHEFAHSLGIEHCTKHKCVIGGIMSVEELDTHPLLPCFEDLTKIAFATGRTLRDQLDITIQTMEKLGLSVIFNEEYNNLVKASYLLS